MIAIAGGAAAAVVTQQAEQAAQQDIINQAAQRQGCSLPNNTKRVFLLDRNYELDKNGEIQTLFYRWVAKDRIENQGIWRSRLVKVTKNELETERTTVPEAIERLKPNNKCQFISFFLNIVDAKIMFLFAEVEAPIL